MKKVSPIDARPAADPNGSFYRFIRIPAIICFFHGVFPFKNVFSLKGDDLSFKYLSLQFAWGYVFYIVTSAISLYSISAKPNYLHLGIVYLVRTWVYFLSSQLYNRRFIQLIRTSERIDREFQKYQNITFPFNKNQHERIYYILIGICYFFNIWTQGLSIFAFSKRLHPNYFLLTSVSVVFTMPRLLSPLMFIVILRILRIRFSTLNSHLEDLVSSGKLIQETDIDNLRILYGKLCGCLDLLLDWCNLRILICLGLLTLETILIAYRCTVVFRRFSLTGDLPVTVTCIVLIYAVSSASENLIASSERVRTTIGRIPLNSLSLRNQNQFRIWLSQMVTIPVKISISGLFDVNRHLITTILAAIATYVTVIIQLEPQLNSVEKTLKSHLNTRRNGTN